MRSERWKYILSLTVSIALGLLIGALIMAATGHDPLDGYGALLRGAFGSRRSWGNTLYKTFQLCITGLATAVASSAGIFNVASKVSNFVCNFYDTAFPGIWLNKSWTFNGI